MANELRVVYVGSETIYAVIYRASDGKVWNGSTWETWSNANIATYDVALVASGGYLHMASRPALITETTAVVVLYMRRNGATPAITDTVLKSESITLTVTAYTAATTTGSGSATSTMTGANVIDTARRLLNDTGADRWYDSVLLDHLNDGMRDLRDKRPDWLMKVDGTMETVVDVSSTTTVLKFNEDARMALAQYICWLATSENDPDKLEAAKSESHRARYLAIVQGGK